ncbi:sensor histidine kinase [Spirosoma fluminis]
MVATLTYRQKWQLAIRLLVLYSPLLLYINLPQSVRTPAKLVELLPFISIVVLIALGLYFIWIIITDWLQLQLFRLFGDDFLLDFNWGALVVSMIISLALALLYAQVFQWIILTIFSFIFQPDAGHHQTHTPPFSPDVFAYLQRVNKVFNLVVMLSAFYLTIISRSYQQLKEVKLRAEQSEKEAALSQVEALKHQLSPHFLFNSLSILISMVHEDADLSEKYIKQLSRVYRYILEQRDQELVSLKTEVEFIQAYTFLLEIRFEHKFNVSIELDQAQQEQYRIAPLALQLLLENAIKHNRMSIKSPLHIRIYCQADVLLVENPLLPRDQPETSTGVGLRNIVNRYALLTPRTVTYGQQDQSFFVKLPLL